MVGDLKNGRFPVEIRAAHRSDLLRRDKLLRRHGAVHRIGGLDVSGAVAAIRGSGTAVRIFSGQDGSGSEDTTAW